MTATGPQAVFTATSFAHAARLVAPIVAAAEEFGVVPDIDVRAEGVVVRIPNREEDGMPATARAFAEVVSRAAADGGLTPDPSQVQSVGIYVAQHSRADVRPFFLVRNGRADEGQATKTHR